jgi:flagellar basal-body rod protein FlgB
MEDITMQIATQMSDEIGKYLNLSSLELKLTAQNMANVDTPGYRAVGIDFAEEMTRSMGDVLAERNEEINGDGAGHGSWKSQQPRVKQVDGLLERPDGNDVSMDQEGLNMAEAQLKFRTGVALLRNEFSGVLDAIHVDQKG